MMTSEELTKTFGEDGSAIINRLFDIASEYGMESVILNCLSRNVTVKYEEEEIDPETYYCYMMEACKIGDWAKGFFAMWKRKQFVKPTIALYQKLIGRQLEGLLKSGFLILDEWTPTDDFAERAEELETWGLAGKNYEHRYCLLRQMMSLENNRLIVDEVVAGRYLESRSEKLTQEGVKCFFCFVQLSQLVYAEIDKLEGPKELLSSSDQALLTRLQNYISNGDWQAPATCDNVRTWINTLFGADLKLLNAEDMEQTRQFRDFFKGGRGGANTDRVEVSMANIVGYLMNCQLLAGGQKQISIAFFGNDGQVNNINKGKNLDGNQDFKNLLPLMDKYRMKIII